MSLVAILGASKVPNPLEHVFNQQMQKIIQFGCSHDGYAALFEDRRTIAVAGGLRPDRVKAQSNQLTVKLISLPTAESSSIAQISVGRSFLLCLTFSGRVYGYRQTACTRTRRERSLELEGMSPLLAQVEQEVKVSNDKLFPIHEVFDTKCYFVFGGSNSRFLWTTNHLSKSTAEEEYNIVYTYGSINDGALGKESTEFGESESFRIVKGRVVKMGSGHGQTIVLSNMGQVYGCGYSHFGELGLGKNMVIPKLIKLEFFNDMFVSDVACGTFHSMFLVTKPQVALYVSGRSQEGQLGNGSISKKPEMTPIQITFPPGYMPIKVAAKGRWSLAITTNGSRDFTAFAAGQVYHFSSERSFAPIFTVPSGYEVNSVSGGEENVAMLLKAIKSLLQNRLNLISKFKDVQIGFLNDKER